MNLSVIACNLLAALKAILPALAGDRDEPVHFRAVQGKRGRYEALSYKGRVVAGAVFPVNDDTGKRDGFTLPGRRLLQWVKAIPADAVIEFDYRREDEQTAASVRGRRIETYLHSEPMQLPRDWPRLLADGQQTAIVQSERLSRALAAASTFAGRPTWEWRNAQWVNTMEPGCGVIEFRKGVLWSTDKRSYSVITMPGLEFVSARIHYENVPAVLEFLDDSSRQQIRIVEAESFFFLVRGDGSHIGIARPQTPLPIIKITNRSSDHVLEISARELKSAVGTAEGQHLVAISRPNPDAPLELVIADNNGIKSIAHLDVTITPEGQSFPATILTYVSHLQGLLKVAEGERVRLGASRQGRSGYFDYHLARPVDGKHGMLDDFSFVFVWRKPTVPDASVVPASVVPASEPVELPRVPDWRECPGCLPIREAKQLIGAYLCAAHRANIDAESEQRRAKAFEAGRDTNGWCLPCRIHGGVRDAQCFCLPDARVIRLAAGDFTDGLARLVDVKGWRQERVQAAGEFMDAIAHLVDYKGWERGMARAARDLGKALVKVCRDAPEPKKAAKKSATKPIRPGDIAILRTSLEYNDASMTVRGYINLVCSDNLAEVSVTVFDKTATYGQGRYARNYRGVQYGLPEPDAQVVKADDSGDTERIRLTPSRKKAILEVARQCVEKFIDAELGATEAAPMEPAVAVPAPIVMVTPAIIPDTQAKRTVTIAGQEFAVQSMEAP